MTAVVPAIVQNGLSDQTRHSNGLAQAFVKASLLATNSEAYAQACLALGSAQDPDYSKIQAPVLVVAGDQDKTSPSATVDFLKQAIKDIKVAPLTGVGHWHMVEDVSGSSRALQDFLG
jgi:pimeloyl-ACP methyl ester carboxylesterase